jgi:hypothetical protein
MKTLYSITVALLLSVGSFAQIHPDFNDTIHIGSTDSFVKAFANDSCYYVFGNDTVDYVAKFDFNGQLVDTFHLDLKWQFGYYHAYTDIKETPSGFLLFTLEGDSNNINYGIIAKLNKQFDTLWTKEIHQIPNLQFYPTNIITDIQETPDGGCIVSGENDIHPWLMKLSATGQRQWYKEYLVAAINKIELTPDMGILLWVYEFQSSSIIKTSALGTVLWKTSIKNHIGYNLVFGMKYYGGSDYILARGIGYGDINKPYDIVSGLQLVRINYSTGQIVFDTNYRPFNELFETEGLSLNILSNGIISVGATPYTYTGTILYPKEGWCSKGAVLYYGPLGDSLGYHLFDIGIPNAREDYLFDLKPTNDGGFIGCGEHITLTFGKNSCYSSPWLFKYTPSWATDIADLENRKPTINSFPNPTDKYFNIEFDKTTQEEFTLTIYAITGSVLEQYQIPKGSKSYQLNLDNLAGGVYIYKLSGINKSLFSGKIIKY